jgi:hypothetical protein
MQFKNINTLDELIKKAAITDSNIDALNDVLRNKARMIIEDRERIGDVYKHSWKDPDGDLWLAFLEGNDKQYSICIQTGEIAELEIEGAVN